MWFSIFIFAIIGIFLMIVMSFFTLRENEIFITTICALFLGIFHILLFISHTEMNIEKGQENRMQYYTTLKSNSSSIQNTYVKNIIKDTEKAIDKQYKNRAVFITVPDDFNSFSRQNEYNQVVAILKKSGFEHIDDTTVSCGNNNRCPALVIY